MKQKSKRWFDDYSCSLFFLWSSDCR
jgi:hypothetical protein